MSTPDDPYASPPRDREAPAERPPVRGAWPPAGGWGAPSGPPASGPAGRPGPGRPGPAGPGAGGGVGTAALVVGVLGLVLGVSIVGGVLLGGLAIGLGLRAQARARLAGGRSGQATAGVLLGVLGFLVAGATYLYVRAPLADYRACLRASTSFADDRACKDELRSRVERS